MLSDDAAERVPTQLRGSETIGGVGNDLTERDTVTRAERAEVERAVAAVIDAVNHLDEGRVGQCFAAGATWVAPILEFPRRVAGREEVVRPSPASLAKYAPAGWAGICEHPAEDVLIQLLASAAGRARAWSTPSR